MSRAASEEVIAGRAAISVNDPGTEVPEGWTRVRLTDIARLESGHTPSRKHPEWWGGDIPWVSLPDAREHHGGVIFDTTQKTNELGLANSAARWLPKDTVCLSRTASVGYVFRLGRPMATSQDFVNWVCSDALDPRFLQQALLAEGKHLLNFGMGTTHTTIYFPAVLAFHISLAPAREQQRIVERVEALLEQVNRAKGRLDRVPQILKRFRQSVLAAACSGELTREWRKQHVDGGSAAKLLDELFVQRRRDHEQQLSRARGTGARKPITPKNLAPARVPDGLSELPDGWAWVLFDDVCDDITVGHVGPMANEYVERGVPFLRSQNVRPFRFDPLGLKFITPAFHQRLVKSSLRPGDIAIVRSGNAGEACVVPPELPEANCADLVVMRPSRILNPIFAVIFINSSAARTHIDDVKVGIAQGHYNIGSARETPVPLPPLAEQVEIVRQVERLFALADTIERRVQAATARAEKLPQAILSKAFAGELVPTEAELARAEGRTYETAEKLLKRVTATAAAPSAKAGAKKRGKAS